MCPACSCGSHRWDCSPKMKEAAKLGVLSTELLAYHLDDLAQVRDVVFNDFPRLVSAGWFTLLAGLLLVWRALHAVIRVEVPTKLNPLSGTVCSAADTTALRRSG